MWLRRIDDSGTEFRYELETFYSAPLMLDNWGQTQMFVLYKYYKNNDGEFSLCRSNEKVYVTIETLLSKFVAIDSEVDKTMLDLESFRTNTYAKNLEDSLSPFNLGRVEDVNESSADNDQITNLDNNAVLNAATNVYAPEEHKFVN